MANFQTYDLLDLADNPRGVYDLANELLPEMAEAMGYDLGETPNTEILQGLIGHIGPAKTLQDNIGLVQERLGTSADAVTIAADWAERSGCLDKTSRGFMHPGVDLSKIGFGAVVFNTGVGRWQERRAKQVIELKESGVKFQKAIIFAGNRAMAETEHPEVAEMAKAHGHPPTESDFASTYITDILSANDISADVVVIESANGDEVFREGIKKKGFLYDWSILAVGNAPSTIQVAAQYRKAACSLDLDDDSRFDATGRQLYMAGDSIAVARQGESPATHQNPFTALGQIARNALMLHEQSRSSV